MRWPTLGVLCALVWWPAAWALDDAKDKDKAKAEQPATPAAELRALNEAFNKARDDVIKELQGPNTAGEEKDKAMKKLQSLPAEYAAKFLMLAEKHAKDKDVAVDALLWIVRNKPFGAEADKAVDLLAKDYLANKKVADTLPSLVYQPFPSAEKLLRAQVKSAAGAETEGPALFTLAQHLKNKADTIRALREVEEKQLKQIEGTYGNAFLKNLLETDPEKLLLETEKLFDKVEADYGKVNFKGLTLAERVKPELFELRHLSVGKTPPEIAGEDIDGKSFKLSEYKGKVVVLDFWGHW